MRGKEETAGDERERQVRPDEAHIREGSNEHSMMGEDTARTANKTRQFTQASR
jgi:hypothetical protein